jgi:hypothetical protein
MTNQTPTTTAPVLNLAVKVAETVRVFVTPGMHFTKA